MMAKTTKKKTLPSHLTDFEKLAGVILLLVYLVVLPFFGRAITDAVGTLLGTSISPALSNVIDPRWKCCAPICMSTTASPFCWEWPLTVPILK